MTNKTTSAIDLLALADSLTNGQREAILSARLMVSGHHRMKWSYAGAVWRSLKDRGLAEDGAYLTPLGLAVRASLESGQ